MNKKIKTVIISMVIILIFVYVYGERAKGFSKFNVVNWDNYYNADNLLLYYDNNDNEDIKKLEKDYKISSLLSEDNSELEKIETLIMFIRGTLDLDNKVTTSFKSGFEILKDKKLKEKSASTKDMTVILRDMLVGSGFTARVGEFRMKDITSKKPYNYYVTEYFSKEFDKWVVLDVENQAYYLNGDIPLSAVEMVDLKGSFAVKSLDDDKKAISNIKKFLYSYNIAIDNTINFKKSNCNLTYVGPNQDKIQLEVKGDYIGPTVFTKNKELFLKSPEKIEIKRDDEIINIILMPKKEENKENLKKKAYPSFIIGAFSNSEMVKDYYVRLNDGEFIKVEGYTEYIFKKGSNKIELSKDGENIDSSINIKVK